MSGFDELKAYVQERFEKLENQIEKMDKNFNERFEKLENQIEKMDKNFNERFEKLEERLYGLEDKVRSIDYRVEDLERGFKRYQKIQEIEGTNEDEFLLKPTPALGGIQGEISPTGRYLRWTP